MTLLSYQVFQTVVGQGSFSEGGRDFKSDAFCCQSCDRIDGAGTWIFPVYEK